MGSLLHRAGIRDVSFNSRVRSALVPLTKRCQEEDAMNVPAFDANGPATVATFPGSVERAFSSQRTLVNHSEHCSFDPDRLVAIGLTICRQVRVRRSPQELALYTVSETRQEPTPTIVRMGRAGRTRLGTSDEFDVTIDPNVPHPEFTDDQARAHSEFVERLDDDRCQRGLAVLAPHGGAIERHTDLQAERVGGLLGGELASVWTCKGFKTGGGAFDRWHITSTDIHEGSFPLLNTIIGRGFAYAVAFHGFSEADVLVGGAAPAAIKQEIAAAVEQALDGSRIQVRIAGPSDKFGGDDPKNIVNRLAATGIGGVQIEQSSKARDGFWQAIADAVAEVYRSNL
jgi:phage replication-related protein YjqB (UPF0714/DUF867 family)